MLKTSLNYYFLTQFDFVAEMLLRLLFSAITLVSTMLSQLIEVMDKYDKNKTGVVISQNY